MQTHVRQILTSLGDWLAHPLAFWVVLGYGMLWLWLQPETFDFHGGATMATWLMTLFIVRADARDDQIIKAKLDELLRLTPGADPSLRQLDHLEVEHVAKKRRNHRRKPQRG